MRPDWLHRRVTKIDQVPEKFQTVAHKTVEVLQSGSIEAKWLLKSGKIAPKLAEQLAVQIVVELMAEFGGQEIYFNKCLESFKKERDAEIRDRFRKAKATARAEGGPFKPYLEKLCRDFDLTERQVRDIAGDHEGQGELF